MNRKNNYSINRASFWLLRHWARYFIDPCQWPLVRTQRADPMTDIFSLNRRYSMECGTNDRSLHTCWTISHCTSCTTGSSTIGNCTGATTLSLCDECSSDVIWPSLTSKTLHWSTWSKASSDEICHSTCEKISLRSNAFSSLVLYRQCLSSVQTTRELINRQMASIRPVEPQESR